MEVCLDADIGRWIVEFLIAQPLEDSLLNSLLSILPPSDRSSSLKKALLLRKMESEISQGSVSETLLDLFEQIEEQDFEDGVTEHEHSGSMAAAYLAVAVACTVKFLGNSGGSSKFDYFDAVKRIWRGRISKLVKTEEVALFSKDLESWMDDIEAAVWVDNACDAVLKRSEGIHVIDTVRFYVKEEREKMGPSFLESIAEASKADQELRGVLGSLIQVSEKTVPKYKNIEVHKGNAHSRRKQIARKRSKCALAGMKRGAKIADIGTSDLHESCKQYDVSTTPVVNRALEALKLSSLELQAVVIDPLPDSLRMAESVVSDMTRKNVSNEPRKESHPRTDPSVVGSQATQANEENLTKYSYGPAPKPSLMAQNGTRCTFEWDDSIDGLPDDLPDQGNRLRLPSPQRSVISPPETYESFKVTNRRKPRKWSALEEDTLRTGVHKYGRGNWKRILMAYIDIFEERTEVDLKDKWRNLTRYG